MKLLSNENLMFAYKKMILFFCIFERDWGGKYEKYVNQYGQKTQEAKARHKLLFFN